MKVLWPILFLILISCSEDSGLPDLPEKLELSGVEARVRDGIHEAYSELEANPTLENFDHYAVLLLAHGLEDDALKVWEALIESQGSNFRREYLAGRCNFKTDPTRARPHFEAALKLDPNYSALNICLAEIYENDGELAEAEALLDTVGGKDRSGTVPFAQARIAFKRGKFQRALRKLDAARNAAPDHRPLLNLYIQTLSRLKREDEADALAKKIQSSEEEGATSVLKIDDPIMREIYLQRLSFVGMMQRAQAAMASNKNEEAAAIFRLICEDKPDDVGLLNSYAESLQKAKKIEESREQFQKSLQIKPGQPQVVYMLGLAEFQLENIPEGIRLMEEVKKMEPGNMEARVMLATALWKTDPQPAALELRHVLVKEPENIQARLLLARIHFGDGRLLAGEEELKKIYAIMPDCQPARDLEKKFLNR